MTTAQLFYQSAYDFVLSGNPNLKVFKDKFKAEHPDISESEMRRIFMDVLDDVHHKRREEVEDDDEN